ncbi:MAG: NHL repeat-containing protein, partial [Solirubrobacterales bacterium]
MPAGQGTSVVAGPETNPQAAAELPHTELDRGEAEELLTSVFPSALEEPAGIFNGELEVEEFHSDHVAVVAPPSPGAQPGLLSSLLPLRTEDAEGEKEAVNLELEHSEGEVDPTNPLVEVQIPAELGEGITLPESNVGIDLTGTTGERSASVVEGSATFYPNVALDTDLAVAPTPTGVETFTQLRSAEAPQSQTYHLSLPAGARLTASQDGGAEIVRGEEVLVAVPPPSAIDAEGNDVPVSLSVSGDSILLHVDPQPEAVYPLLLDPVYESYSWMNAGTNTGIYSDWRPASSNEAVFKPSWIGVWGETMHAGLDLRSYAGAATPGYQANWNYYVPRFFSDYENPAIHERPTSFIRNMTLSQVYYLIEEGSPVHEDPYLLVGLWDENKGEFSTMGTRTGAQGGYSNQTIALKNESEYTDVKNGGIALATVETASYPRQAFVGSATVEVTDKDSPSFGLLGNPSGWMNETAASAIPYKVSDPGLGIYSLQVKQPQSAGGFKQITTSNGCLGTAGNPCPRTTEAAGRTISYEPKTMTQGEDWVQVTASDPVENQSSVGEARIKIDHTAPTLALSGNLTEQASVGTKLSSYTLNYAAADGDETAPAATAPIGTAGTGQGQMQRPFGVAVDKSGNVWMVDRENNCVEVYGPSGNLIRQFGSSYGAPGSGNGQLSSPQGIAISSSGNVWVTDPGNKRVEEFNEKGEFIRSLTYAGGLLGQGKMAEPYAVATGPEETLWVTDTGSHRVYQFKENGTFVKAISSVGPLLHEVSL